MSVALLGLLRAVSAALPVLIDDLPLLDRPSAGVLGFVARRVSGNRIGFLAASRCGEDTFFDAQLPVERICSAPLPATGRTGRLVQER